MSGSRLGYTEVVRLVRLRSHLINTRSGIFRWHVGCWNSSIMLKTKAGLIALTVAAFAKVACYAQDPLKGTLTMGLGDVAAIKQKAEAGDPVAQVNLGDVLVSKFRPAEALGCYLKAAAQGNPDGRYHAGHILLFGAAGLYPDQKVAANPAEGLKWTFMAATNLHPLACQNMAKAFQAGIGVQSDLVESYAWWQLFTDSGSGSIVGRVSMNDLALKMSTDQLAAAKTRVTQFHNKQWPINFLAQVAQRDHRLRLNGVTFREKGSLAVINGKTLAEGESAKMSLTSGPAVVKCLKIEKDSVLIAVQGEDQPRRLSL
jgi:hypothetical protein